MFYLTAFLTLLISLLIYMMDPAAPDLRRETDMNFGKAYVASFFAQHQAARDYLYHWLGRVYPLNPKSEGYPADVSQNVRAIALPGDGLDAFFSRGAAIERWCVPDGKGDCTAKGYLKVADMVASPGDYLSGLVCLDASNQLAQCYKYMCVDSSGNSTHDQTSCVDSIAQVSFANGVSPYVITYGSFFSNEWEGAKRKVPQWWYEQGKVRAVRLEAWRKAIASLSRGSHNCGIITAGPWDELVSYDAGRQKKRYTLHTGAGGTQYCLSDGNRCMRFIPAGIVSALRVFLDEDNLDGIFLCLSPVTDPYLTSGKPIPYYHFDGIDNLALGADKHETTLPAVSGTQLWYPVRGNSAAQAPDGAGTRGVKTTTNGMTMPFRYPADDFTLSFVMTYYDNQEEGWMVGTGSEALGIDPSSAGAASKGAVGVYRNKDNIWLYYDGSGTTTQMLPQLLEGTHSWTIVRKGNKVHLYIDGWHFIDSGQSCGDAPDSLGFDVSDKKYGVGENVVFGRTNSISTTTSLASVRYYNVALNEDQIRENFEVDYRRFGVVKLNINAAASSACELKK